MCTCGSFSMELSKKAAKFTKIIASKLKDVIEEDCDKEALKDIFRTAVKSIKKKQIQQEIEKNKEKYLKKLEKHLKVLRNGKQNREKNNARNTSFPCNLYRIETVNKDELEGKDEKLVNFLISERLNENLDLLNVGEDSEKYCKGFPELSKYHRVLRLNLEGSLEILKVTLINYFGKIQKLSEEVIQDEDKERASELAEEIKGFVCTCHLQKQRFSQTEADVIRPTYNDTLASLLSIYLDLMIIIYRDNELPKKKGQHLYGYVAYMLPWINQLCILLELTTVTEKDTKLVLPFVKSCLKWRPETTDNPTYLHYILAVRAMHSKLGTHVQNIIEETKAISAPKGFLKWLSTQDSELVEEFPDDKKFKGRAVTRFLLDDLTEDQEESLINVLVDYGGECQQVTETNEDKNSAETDNVTDGDKVDDLFFIDSGPNKMENSELFFLDKGSGSHTKTDEKNNSEDPEFVSMETDQQMEEMQTEVFVIDTDNFQQQNNKSELSDEEEFSRKQSKKKSQKLSKVNIKEQNEGSSIDNKKKKLRTGSIESSGQSRKVTDSDKCHNKETKVMNEDICLNGRETAPKKSKKLKKKTLRQDLEEQANSHEDVCEKDRMNGKTKDDQEDEMVVDEESNETEEVKAGNEKGSLTKTDEIEMDNRMDTEIFFIDTNKFSSKKNKAVFQIEKEEYDEKLENDSSSSDEDDNRLIIDEREKSDSEKEIVQKRKRENSSYQFVDDDDDNIKTKVKDSIQKNKALLEESEMKSIDSDSGKHFNTSTTPNRKTNLRTTTPSSKIGLNKNTETETDSIVRKTRRMSTRKSQGSPLMKTDDQPSIKDFIQKQPSKTPSKNIADSVNGDEAVTTNDECLKPTNLTSKFKSAIKGHQNKDCMESQDVTSSLMESDLGTGNSMESRDDTSSLMESDIGFENGEDVRSTLSLVVEGKSKTTEILSPIRLVSPKSQRQKDLDTLCTPKRKTPAKSDNEANDSLTPSRLKAFSPRSDIDENGSHSLEYSLVIEYQGKKNPTNDSAVKKSQENPNIHSDVVSPKHFYKDSPPRRSRRSSRLSESSDNNDKSQNQLQPKTNHQTSSKSHQQSLTSSKKGQTPKAGSKKTNKKVSESSDCSELTDQLQEFPKLRKSKRLSGIASSPESLPESKVKQSVMEKFMVPRKYIQSWQANFGSPENKAAPNEQNLQDASSSLLTQQDVQSKMLSPVIEMVAERAKPPSNLDISSIENIEPITGSKTKKSYSLRNRKSTKESEELVYNSFDESDGEDIGAVPDITKHMKPAPNESISGNVDNISKSSSLTKIKSKMDSVVESPKDINKEAISECSVKLRKTRSTRKESRSTSIETRSPMNKSTSSQEADSKLNSSTSTKKSSKKTRSPSKPVSEVKKNMDYINKRLNLTDVDEQLSTPRSSRKRKSSIVDSPQTGSVSETAKSDRSVRRKLIGGKILDQNVTIESCDTDEDDSTTKSRTSHSKRDKIDTPESSKNLQKSKERGMTLRQRQL